MDSSRPHFLNMLKTTLLIALLTLGGARKEATKRWPAGAWTLKVDQTKTVYVYALTVTLQRNRQALMGMLCAPETRTFYGKDWQAVLDASKDYKATCTAN